MANISKVYLLNTPLEDDMKNTLYFSNATAQKSYMDNNVLKTYLNVSYQRDTSTFRCPAQIDSIRECNYIMYQNTAYSNKWFYGFIKKMTYVSDGMTDVQFEIDPIQTFMFDITVRPSFVEREHTNNDTVGNNLVPENVEIGDYVGNGTPERVGFGGTNRYVVNTNYTPDNQTILGTNLNGVPIAGAIIAFKYWQQMINNIQTISGQGHLEGIKNAFIVPSEFLDVYDSDWTLHGNTDDTVWYSYKGTTSPYFIRKVLSRPSTIDGYTPRNKKLLTSPFQYCMLVNNNGTVNSLKYEYFSNPSAFVIEAKGTICVGCSIMVYPENYKGVEKNYTEGISQGKFPTLSWSGDAYTNWLTQNAVNLNLGVVSDTVNLATSLIGGGNKQSTGSTASSVANFGLSIADTLATVYQHGIAPQSISGNINSGDMLTSDKTNSAYLYKMSIRSEFAQLIDSYFDLYGYATHKLKVPNTNHRANWWYTKTIDCNITGNVPNDYMNQIKDAYNSGITFWRNPSNFLNYSVSNGIV